MKCPACACPRPSDASLCPTCGYRAGDDALYGSQNAFTVETDLHSDEDPTEYADSSESLNGVLIVRHDDEKDTALIPSSPYYESAGYESSGVTVTPVRSAKGPTSGMNAPANALAHKIQPDAVPVAIQAGNWTPRSQQEATIYYSIDGIQTVRELQKSTGISPMDVIVALLGLIECGVARIFDTTAVPQVVPIERARGTRRPSPRPITRRQNSPLRTGPAQRLGRGPTSSLYPNTPPLAPAHRSVPDDRPRDTGSLGRPDGDDFVSRDAAGRGGAMMVRPAPAQVRTADLVDDLAHMLPALDVDRLRPLDLDADDLPLTSDVVTISFEEPDLSSTWDATDLVVAEYLISTTGQAALQVLPGPASMLGGPRPAAVPAVGHAPFSQPLPTSSPMAIADPPRDKDLNVTGARPLQPIDFSVEVVPPTVIPKPLEDPADAGPVPLDPQFLQELESAALLRDEGREPTRKLPDIRSSGHNVPVIAEAGQAPTRKLQDTRSSGRNAPVVAEAGREPTRKLQDVRSSGHTAPVAPTEPDSEPPAGLNTAVVRRRRSQNRKAEKLFEEALKDQAAGNLVSARINMKLALIYEPDNREYRTALRAIDHDPAARPRTPSTLQKKAHELFEEAKHAEHHGKVDHAIGLLEQAVRHSRQAVYLNRLGVLLATKRGAYDQAQALLIEATKLKPGNTTYARNLNKVRYLGENSRGAAHQGAMRQGLFQNIYERIVKS